MLENHQIKISHELYGRMLKIRDEKKLVSVGAAVEYYIEKLEEQYLCTKEFMK